MNRSVAYLGLLTALVSPYALSAATLTPPSLSAGVVERQIVREYNLQNLSPTRDIPILEVDVPREVLNIPSGISAYIKKVVLQKNYPILDKETDRVLSLYENRELNGDDLMRLCYEIQRIYAEEGYILTWVYPPVQRVDNGVLTINVLEGTLKEIEVQGNVSYKTRFIKSYFEKLQEGPVNYNELMKALLLVNQNSDIQVQAILRKGVDTGEVDLILRVQDKMPLHLSAGYNNWGSSSTTFNQLASTFTVGNIATSGDKFVGQVSCGVPFVFYYVNPSYTIPLTGSGSNLVLSYAFSQSNTQDYKSFDLSSWSELASITYNQPLAATRRFQASINTSFNFNQYKNLQDGFTTSYDRIRAVNFGGMVDYTDSLSGRNVLSPSLSFGIPYILGGMDINNDPLCSRPGGGGRYFILTLNGQRVQPLLTDCMLVLTVGAQGTLNKIPTSVQYVLGGEGTVRGYTSAIAVGDNGYCANLEFYIPPPFLKNKPFRPMKTTWGQVLQLLAFIDHGGIYTLDSVPGEYPSAYLTSVGLGFRFYGPKNMSLSFDAGFPVQGGPYREFNSILYVRFNMDFL